MYLLICGSIMALLTILESPRRAHHTQDLHICCSVPEILSPSNSSSSRFTQHFSPCPCLFGNIRPTGYRFTYLDQSSSNLLILPTQVPATAPRPDPSKAYPSVHGSTYMAKNINGQAVYSLLIVSPIIIVILTVFILIKCAGCTIGRWKQLFSRLSCIYKKASTHKRSSSDPPNP